MEPNRTFIFTLLGEQLQTLQCQVGVSQQTKDQNPDVFQEKEDQKSEISQETDDQKTLFQIAEDLANVRYILYFIYIETC